MVLYVGAHPEEEDTLFYFHRKACAERWDSRAVGMAPYGDPPSYMLTRRTAGHCLWCAWCGQKAFDGDGRGCADCAQGEVCPEVNEGATIWSEEIRELLYEDVAPRHRDLVWEIFLQMISDCGSVEPTELAVSIAYLPRIIVRYGDLDVDPTALLGRPGLGGH